MKDLIPTYREIPLVIQSIYQRVLDALWLYYMRLPESLWERFVYRVWKVLS